MPPADETVLKLQEILHDSVVHNGNLAVAARVGMGIGEDGATVGGPPGMPKAQRPTRAASIQGRDQVLHAPHGLVEFRLLVRPQRHHAGAVVAAVLQTLQPCLN